MSGEINYGEWFDRVDARVREIEEELTGLRPLLAYLAPLAKRGDPAQLVMPGTPVPRPTPPVEPAPLPAVATPAQTETETETEEAAGHEREPIYSRMNSLSATLHYLASVGGRSTTAEAAKALRAGGLKSKSPQFVNNIYTTMRRLTDRGLLDRLGTGLHGEWELTEAGWAEAGRISETVEGAPTPPTVSEDQTGDEASGDTPRLALTP